MAKASFNFGLNRRPKTKKPKKTSGKKRSPGTRNNSNAWRSYIGGSISNAPIPD